MVFVKYQHFMCQVDRGAFATDAEASQIRLFGKQPGRIFIHPSSVLFDENKFDNIRNRLDILADCDRFATPHAVFFEKACTGKVYIRDVTVMPSYPILLFGGKITVDHEAGVLLVDDWYFKFENFFS